MRKLKNEELNNLLEKIFSNINDWLHFAEAKNAANIALVGAFITAIFNTENINILSYLICIILVVSGVCSLISFIPRIEEKTDATEKKTANNELDEENLLFYENIKMYSANVYLRKIIMMYFDNNKEIEIGKYQIDLSNEIIYNSGIVSIKYTCFRYAIILDIVAFVILAVYVIVA